MKLSAQISGQRPGAKARGEQLLDVSVSMTLENGSIEFFVPPVDGSPGLRFTIDRAEHDEAYESLSKLVPASSEKPATRPRSSSRRRSTGEDTAAEPAGDVA